MLTTKEINISNQSYINKDFGSVYPELLDLCSRITERWDPDASNESDPGIVLLKLAAFIADKNNYNTDKNILESFMPSATQESSMRKLCDMNGYSMRYYRSAITPITFMYTGDLTIDDEGNPLEDTINSFTLKKYETVVKSEDESLAYTLIEDCPIAYSNVYSTAKAIEGTIQILTVGDSTTITLNNIDENNRVYLPEKMVAENGIFVTDVDTNNTWTNLVTSGNNLNIIELNTKAFKFGYDSNRDLPYIEFPSDIANLIGNGLVIRYILTSGASGNTSAGNLNTLSAPSSVVGTAATVSDLTDNLKVTNSSAATSGQDPESIDEAYSNFKKTIGTFNTLVTARDYANFIYNIVDADTLKNIVSNVQAADRRTDYNYSNNIVSYSVDAGEHMISNTSDDDITPYDLCLYPLQPVADNYSTETYNATFEPLDLYKVIDNVDLKSTKCMSHNFKQLNSNELVYCFKNKYELDIKLETYEKQLPYYQDEIINNVKNALYQNFNARMVDWGEEIPRDTIRSVIMNCDSRIKAINLSYKITPYIMDPAGDDTALADSSIIASYTAKNILSGSISLFDYNTDYNIEFGQEYIQDMKKFENTTDYKATYDNYKYKLTSGASWEDNNYSGIENITNITTALTVPLNAISTTRTDLDATNCLTNGYLLQENETLQFIAPNLSTELEYGTYVNYRVEGLSEDIQANTIHRLSGNEIIKILYTDADTGNEIFRVYTNNSITENGVLIASAVKNIFKANFVLSNTIDAGSAAAVSYRDEKYGTLNSNQIIDKMVYVTTTISQNATLPCYWIMNNENNSLFTTTNYQNIILDNSEYFIYSNSNLTELTILGAGTKLSLASAPASDWVIDTDSMLSIETISDKGLSAFSSLNWMNMSLANNVLSIDEMQIKTYNAGDKIKITNSNISDYVSNDWISLGKDAVITGVLSDGSSISLNLVDDADWTWQVRAKLNLNVGPNKEQLIRYNHWITLLHEVEGESTLVYPLYNPTRNWNSLYDVDFTAPVFKLNYLTQLFGGVDVDVNSVIISSIKLVLNDGITALYYTPVDKISRSSISNMIEYNLEETKSAELDILPLIEDRYVFVYFDKYNNNNVTITATNASGDPVNLININDNSTPSTSIVLNKHINVIKLPKADDAAVKFKFTYPATGVATSDKLYIGEIKVVNNAPSENILAEIRTLDVTGTGEDREHLFCYLNTLDTDKTVNTSDILSAESLWDKNNIANRFTIAQIDFAKSSIDLDSDSKKEQ